MSWPSAFQAVAGTELVIECVMASQKGMPPTKAYLMLNDKSIPEQSQEYTVSRDLHDLMIISGLQLYSSTHFIYC